MTPRSFACNTVKTNIVRTLLGALSPAVLLAVTLLPGVTLPARAEGSRDMVSSGGDRPFTEWASGTTAGIPRRTLLKVYVQAGETLNLGSSVHTSATNPADIVYRNPSGQQGSCDVLNTGFGWINTLAKESAGPLPNAGGYTPCVVAATQTGIYEVEFHAPATSGNPTPTSATAAFPTDATQRSGVAAWDITVRNSGGTAQLGRVHTSYVAMNMGSNNRFLASDFYIQTWDGYLYRTDMNNVDPFGFIFFGNSRGFLDVTNGSTLYHSAQAIDNNLNPFFGNVVVQNPLAANNPATNSYTHLVFFNPPDVRTLDYLGIPRAPSAPQPPTDFRFVGANNTDNRTLVGAGGYFDFTVAGGSSYSIILDTNADGVFNAATDRVLENVLVPGANRVFWDGKDTAGNNLPPRPSNAPYGARIVIRNGEYHFPMLDAENNTNGFIIEMMNPPQSFPALLDINGAPIDRYTIYYDDANYTTANGTVVSLDGGGATSPRDATGGIRSINGEHEFSSGYGDFKGIDTWSFFPSEAVFSNVIVTTQITNPNLLLVKRITAINGIPITDLVDGINSSGDPNYVPSPRDQDDNHANWPSGFLRGRIRDRIQPGDQIEFTIYFLSNGTVPAQNVLFCDLVPTNVTFLPAAYNATAAANGPNPVPGVTTSGGDRGIVLGLGTQASTNPYPILASLSNTSDGDVGRYVAPGTNLTTLDARLSSCGSNTNGAIVVNLANLPQATSAGNPPNSYGFVRFQGRVN
ncbi:DUF11 domain-containing protein [Nodosilinea sp. LEGE 07088]|uniref:DUF11 domain-containing protein n=1 Tax=Nodosilinea sp. LEGE 07088 TaxID=2777968 RepID=UPI00187E0F67|nr:DUF11 domain-containing protein [Nodosilinea sp. LEGE 07088]MBE9137914.1 DUF11 domain-containing protein [Nodosilinea sp. LEGE 07088]